MDADGQEYPVIYFEQNADYKPHRENENELYQSAQKEVDEAISELEKAGLSQEQNKVVDKAISATNASGAAYGATAYRQ